MAERSQRDVVDYIDDASQDEDETPFVPVRPDSSLDAWSAFWGGILLGLSGAGLVTLAPWLAGLLIFVGYSMTALSLRRSSNGFGRALKFGYALVAAVGAVMLFGSATFPNMTASLISAAAAHNIIFVSLATLAWPIALLKYICELL